MSDDKENTSGELAEPITEEELIRLRGGEHLYIEKQKPEPVFDTSKWTSQAPTIGEVEIVQRIFEQAADADVHKPETHYGKQRFRKLTYIFGPWIENVYFEKTMSGETELEDRALIPKVLDSRSSKPGELLVDEDTRNAFADQFVQMMRAARRQYLKIVHDASTYKVKVPEDDLDRMYTVAFMCDDDDLAGALQQHGDPTLKRTHVESMLRYLFK